MFKVGKINIMSIKAGFPILLNDYPIKIGPPSSYMSKSRKRH